MNEPTGPHSGAHRVARGIVEWAAREPDREAVADATRRITYAELDALAGTLARRLVDIRLADDQWLPILVSRDVASTVALQAAFRAGVRFAPLDASMPQRRLTHLLDRLGNPAFAVNPGTDTGHVLPHGITAIPVPDTDDDPLDPVDVERTDEAAVVFTSGSTGVPKGVVHDWSSFEYSMDFQARRPDPVDGPARISLLSSLAFIAGLNRMGEMALGRAFVIGDAASMSVHELAAWFERERLQTISLVPSHAAAIVDGWLPGRRLDRVTHIRTFGEPLYWEHVPALRALCRDDTIIESNYGASEATAGVLIFEIDADTPLETGRVPLGRSQDAGRVVLAPRDDLAAGLGEIVVTSHVACRYLGDDELTAARFSTDEEGRRSWRSGDIASCRTDGTFIQHGRIDDMIKINGLLVEPAEPERVLRSLDGVRAVAVLPQLRGDAPPRLVAHLVLADGSSLTPAAVDASLRADLPAHLVPGIVMVHDELPLTPRNKLDRTALAALPLIPWRADAPPRPHSDAEWFAIGAACQVLDIEGVGLDDDLWARGLDSLAAVQLCSMIADAGHGEVEPTRLLVHRSPRAIAALLGRRVPDRTSDAVVLNPEGTRPPLFFIPGAGMTALSAVAIAAALGADQPVVALEAAGLHRRCKVDRTVPAAARSALDEIDRLQPDGPVVLAGFSAGGPVAYEVGQLLGARGRSVHVLMFDAGLLAGRGDGGLRRARAAARSVPAVARWAMRESVIGWRMIVPGSPNARASRYAAFRRLGRRASRRYAARPARFPVTVYEVEGSTAGARTSPFVELLEVVRVRGDHRSHIEVPHVTEVADHLREVLARHSGHGRSGTGDILGPSARTPPD